MIRLVKREAHIEVPQEDISPSNRLNRLLAAVILLIRGEIESVDYEELSRQLVGAGGYILYTIDKVVQSCLKHVHSMLSESVSNDTIVAEWLYPHVQASFAAYLERKNEFTLNGYRDQVLKILQAFRLPIFRVDCAGRHLSVWYMGNSQEIQMSGDSFLPSEEFSKYSRDFLSLHCQRSVGV